MLCPNCQKEVPDTAKACGYCGHWLVEKEEDKTILKGQTSPKEPTKSSPPWLWIAIGVVALVVVVGVITFLVGRWIGSIGVDSEISNITNHKALDVEPGWSPDSSKLVFASDRDDNWEIYKLDLNGTANRMTNDPASDREPAWSPDGSKFAFASDRDGNWEIYVLGSAGTASRMTNNPASDREPVWSPDGSKFAFASDRDGNWEIYVLGSAGAASRMTNDQAMDREPVWSPDGSKFGL